MVSTRGANERAIDSFAIAPETSGWFRNEIKSVEELKGLKMRFFGLGAQVMQKLGVSTQLLAAADIYPALERMQAIGMVFCIHGEVTDPEVDMFDREAVFIDRILTPLVRDFPALKMVLEHITTRQAAEFVADHASTRVRIRR